MPEVIGTQIMISSKGDWRETHVWILRSLHQIWLCALWLRTGHGERSGILWMPEWAA